MILSSSMAGKTPCAGKSDEGLFERTFSTTISASYVQLLIAAGAQALAYQ